MKKRLHYLVPLIIFLALFLIGYKYDYQISERLYFKDNIFGLIFSGICPFFTYVFLAFLGGYALRFAITRFNIIWEILFIGGSICLYGAAVYWTQDKVFTVNAFNYPNLKWIAIVVSMIVQGVIFYLGFKITKDNDDLSLLLGGLCFLTMMIIVLVPITQLFKIYFHRPRFRLLINGEFGLTPSDFLPVFKSFPDERYDLIKETVGKSEAVKEGFKSFPSGHVGEAASLIFTLPYLCNFFPKLKNKKTIAYYIGIVYTLLMLLSRITMGAHFLTDTSFTALLIVVFMIIGNELNYNIFYKKQYKMPAKV